MMPCRKFFLATIFPKNVGGGGEVENIFFRTFKKKGSKKFIGHKPVKLRVKKIFPDKFLLKHG
jgi:hypothetical protein